MFLSCAVLNHTTDSISNIFTIHLSSSRSKYSSTVRRPGPPTSSSSSATANDSAEQANARGWYLPKIVDYPRSQNIGDTKLVGARYYDTPFEVHVFTFEVFTGTKESTNWRWFTKQKKLQLYLGYAATYPDQSGSMRSSAPPLAMSQLRAWSLLKWHA